MNAAATDEPADELSDEQRRGRRVRFELIFNSLWLALGLFLLPAMIFWVGTPALGPYAEPTGTGNGAGISTFYIDFFGDLAEGSGRAWSIALGPLVLISILRALFIGVKDTPRSDVIDEDEPPVRRAPSTPAVNKTGNRPSRVEPRMGAD
jgi:hypothetical protein